VSHIDFDGAVEAYRQALGAFIKGDPRPVAEHFSRRDDVTLANPFGPPRLGWSSVEKAIEAAAANFEDGSVRFEELSRYSTADLGYVVYLERAEVRLAGREEMVSSSLRVTMIFRLEGDTWKVAHRHADPITTAQPISTIIDTQASR
jgi:ketosteroid isomerase-like protein